MNAEDKHTHTHTHTTGERPDYTRLQDHKLNSSTG